jgi:hypothetical protein
LPDPTRVHLDSGYDSAKIRDLLGEQALTGVIACDRDLYGWSMTVSAC